MRKITKGNEPASLSAWKRRRANNNKTYNDLGHSERQDIRAQCTEEQFYLCAYCCARISGENHDTMNEHIQARDIFPNLSLDYANIVASCTTSNQCDDSHQNQGLPLTPLMGECETELKFYLSGRVKGLTPRAEETIRVLNLGDTAASNKTLVAKRKQLSLELLYEQGLYPDDPIDDEALLNDVISDLLSPVDGKLKPFAPVVANILRGWIEGNPIC